MLTGRVRVTHSITSNIQMEGRHSVSDEKPSNEHPQFVPSWGSRVGGQHKDKKQRITEALSDLQLVLSGMASGGEGRRNADEMIQVTASLARACSVFLRKVVLGEARNREARLLDDGVLESLEMHLQPLRRIPKEGRRTIETGFHTKQVTMMVTRLDEVTKQPREQYMAVGGAQGLSIVVEWPLVGMVDWAKASLEGEHWRVSEDQLFDTDSERDMRCYDWLGQQVVMFDKQGVTLEKLIRTVANLEGVHAINVGRLSVVEGETPSRAMKEPHIHILRNITFFGIGYAELVVIEAGLYLYQRLMQEPSIERPSGSFYLVTPTFECSPEDAILERPPWLQYRGGTMISFSPEPGVVRHTVRAPG